MRPAFTSASACKALLCLLLITGGKLTHARSLKVGVYQNEPKIYNDAHGQPAGIQIEILQAIAREEGWQLEFVTCQWQDCLSLTRSGELDLLPDVAFTEARKNQFDFHQTPALRSWSQLYRHKDAPIVSLQDLAGKRIAVLAGSAQEEFIGQTLQDMSIHAELIPTVSLHEAFRLASSGGADAAIANHYFGQYNASRYELRETAVIFLPSRLFFATALNQNGNLLERIDAHLQAWRQQPESTYYRILKKWSTPPASQRISPALWWGMSALLALFLFALLLSLILRWQVKLRTRRLQEASLALEATLNAIPDLLFEVDFEGRIWNYRAPRTELLAAPASVFMGKRFSEILPAEAAEACLAALHEAHQQGYSTGQQYCLELPQGKCWFELSVSCKKAEAATQPHFIMLCRDISHRKQSELELQANLEALARLNHSLETTQQQLLQSGKLAAIGQLAAGVAHEINNPISFIKSNLYYLQGHIAKLFHPQAAQAASETEHSEPHAPPSLKEILGIIAESIEGAERIQRIVRDLNTFARSSSTEWGRANPEALLERALRLILNEIRFKVEIHKAYAGVPDIDCQAPQLDQVFLNLLSNAANATGPKGQILLRSGYDAEHVWIEIEDNGCGIPTGQLNRIFEPFFTTRPADKATGLGLSIAYGIVERHHGRISVQSELGKGSIFRVSLPRSQPARSN